MKRNAAVSDASLRKGSFCFFLGAPESFFSSLSGKSADRVILFFDVSQEIIDTQIVIETKDFDPRTRTIKKSKKRENDS